MFNFLPCNICKRFRPANQYQLHSHCYICSARLHSPLVIFLFKTNEEIQFTKQNILWNNRCETVESCNLTFAGVTKEDKAV